MGCGGSGHGDQRRPAGQSGGAARPCPSSPSAALPAHGTCRGGPRWARRPWVAFFRHRRPSRSRWPGLAVVALALLLAGGRRRVRRKISPARLWLGAALVAALALGNLVVAGQPWGVGLTGLGLWASKEALRQDGRRTCRPRLPGPAPGTDRSGSRKCARRLLTDVTSLTNLGIIGGAFLVAAVAARVYATPSPTCRAGPGLAIGGGTGPCCPRPIPRGWPSAATSGLLQRNVLGPGSLARLGPGLRLRPSRGRGWACACGPSPRAGGAADDPARHHSWRWRCWSAASSSSTLAAVAAPNPFRAPPLLAAWGRGQAFGAGAALRRPAPGAVATSTRLDPVERPCQPSLPAPHARRGRARSRAGRRCRSRASCAARTDPPARGRWCSGGSRWRRARPASVCQTSAWAKTVCPSGSSPPPSTRPSSGTTVVRFPADGCGIAPTGPAQVAGTGTQKAPATAHRRRRPLVRRRQGSWSSSRQMEKPDKKATRAASIPSPGRRIVAQRTGEKRDLVPRARPVGVEPPGPPVALGARRPVGGRSPRSRGRAPQSTTPRRRSVPAPLPPQPCRNISAGTPVASSVPGGSSR